ncbi:alginate lyase-domain-containing protein [Mycotypha africana]|uniref:alginate lyase-domain-containing protein n=1 Tax=Mycotypha africana TaxID=64632 RepID=UPI0023005237|nr:alginate lyase-domain-containing protein [Mycotypha africana]KAI8977399.1 alginate lyase-domain-containing protein [Mycotypha africana]
MSHATTKENPNDINTKYIRKDGKRNPDIAIVKDQTNLEAIAESLTFLCLGFYLLMNENYAKHAVTLLDAFFVNESTRMNPNLNYAQFIRGPQNTTKLGRGEGVISARFLTRIANLLPLLTNYGGYNAIQQPVYNWFNAYLNWLKTSPVALEAANAKNNIHSWYNVQLAAIEQYVNPASPDIPNRLRHFFNQTVPKQIDRRTGDQPLESQRTRPFHYLAFNLQAILFLTELAYDYGIEIGPMTPPLIRSATCHISKFADDPNVDITVAARCAEIVVGRLEDPNNTCHNFIQRAHTCKFSEKLSGPKNALSILWS